MAKRETGKPAVTVDVLPGTPEQAERNRERLRSVCEKIMSRIAGRPMDVRIEWTDEEKRNT